MKNLYALWHTEKQVFISAHGQPSVLAFESRDDAIKYLDEMQFKEAKNIRIMGFSQHADPTSSVVGLGVGNGVLSLSPPIAASRAETRDAACPEATVRWSRNGP